MGLGNSGGSPGDGGLEVLAVGFVLTGLGVAMVVGKGLTGSWETPAKVIGGIGLAFFAKHKWDEHQRAVADEAWRVSRGLSMTPTPRPQIAMTIAPLPTPAPTLEVGALSGFFIHKKRWEY